MVQRGKESHEVRYPKNLAGTHWPLKQLLLLHGGPFQADRVLCGEEQRQVGATGGPPEGADATTAHHWALWNNLSEL